jgi:hypothetical protein
MFLVDKIDDAADRCSQERAYQASTCAKAVESTFLEGLSSKGEFIGF